MMENLRRNEKRDLTCRAPSASSMFLSLSLALPHLTTAGFFSRVSQQLFAAGFARCLQQVSRFRFAAAFAVCVAGVSFAVCFAAISSQDSSEDVTNSPRLISRKSRLFKVPSENIHSLQDLSRMFVASQGSDFVQDIFRRNSLPLQNPLHSIASFPT